MEWQVVVEEQEVGVVVEEEEVVEVAAEGVDVEGVEVRYEFKNL